MGELVVYFKVKFFLFIEQCKTIAKFYLNMRFALYDGSIALSSFFLNPYRVCRKFLESKGVDIVDGYGETPYSTFKLLSDAAQITEADNYVELGSGRGKTCVWASLFLRCQVTGYEWVPSLRFLSKNLCALLRIPVSFKQTSMFEADLTQATVVYLYSTQLTENELKKLSFSSMPLGARLITISQPYPNFKLLQSIPVVFPWGETQAFIQIKSI